MSINNIFCGEIRKYYTDTPSYLELCRITRNLIWDRQKAGPNSGMVLFSRGLNKCVQRELAVPRTARGVQTLNYRLPM